MEDAPTFGMEDVVPNTKKEIVESPPTIQKDLNTSPQTRHFAHFVER